MYAGIILKLAETKFLKDLCSEVVLFATEKCDSTSSELELVPCRNITDVVSLFDC